MSTDGQNSEPSIRDRNVGSETKTNKELGGEYWTKSHDLHMKEDDLPTLENYAIGHNRATLDNRATLARLVERDVDGGEEPNIGGG